MIIHDFVDKPWGSYKIIYTDKNCRIKILKVNPNSKMSYHMHHCRDEQWTVVVGEAEVRIDGENKILKEGDRIFVPRNVKHSIRNPSVYDSLKIVEIQTGHNFSEDDIFRFEE